MASIVQSSLIGGLLEELLGVVSCGLGLGECGSEGVEGPVLHHLRRVFGHGPSDDVDVPLDHLLRRSALGQGGQGRGSHLGVSRLEVDHGLMGGSDLLVVVAELVPASGGDDGEDRGVEEHRQGSSVPGGSLAEHGPHGTAQGTGMVVIGSDAGPGGALERGRCLTELGSNGLGRDER